MTKSFQIPNAWLVSSVFFIGSKHFRVVSVDGIVICRSNRKQYSRIDTVPLSFIVREYLLVQKCQNACGGEEY